MYIYDFDFSYSAILLILTVGEASKGKGGELITLVGKSLEFLWLMRRFGKQKG